jgi:hypothetical protein
VTLLVDETRMLSEERLVPDWPYILRVADELEAGGNLLIEKARQMLLTWICMGTMLWDITFKDHVPDLAVSRKQEIVDDGGDMSTANSLLGKVRFIWDRLPRHLKPNLHFKYLLIENMDNGSLIRGESANPRAGSSATWHRALLDEAAHIPRSMSVHASVQQACKKNKIVLSTPLGRDNVLGYLRFRTNPPFGGYRYIPIDWREHPDHDDAWFAEQAAQLTPTDLAREICRSYEHSVAGRVYRFDSATQLAQLHPYDPTGPVYRGWDFGTGAPTAVVWYQKLPLRDLVLDYMEMTGSSDEEIVDAVMSRHFSMDVTENSWGLGAVSADHGDPAGRNRQSDLSSWFSRLQSLSEKWVKENGCGTPIRLSTKHLLSLAERVKLGQRVITRVVLDESRAVRFYEIITSRVFPTDDQGRVTADVPVSDWTKHGCDAFEHIIANIYSLDDVKERRSRVATHARESMRRLTAGLMQREF